MANKHREVCYQCHRPQTSCMCTYIQAIETNTRFVILMHPKEFKRTKNGTGHFTNLSLKNCEIFVGIDFSTHEKINQILNDPHTLAYVLYPSKTSINLNQEKIGQADKSSVIFLIDSTWPCSRAMLKASPNIDALPKVSFTHTKNSKFAFKEQPNSYCLSTMESTLCLLELLNAHGIEENTQEELAHFLLPFYKMVDYQLKCNL